MVDKLTDCPCTTIEQDEDCPVGYPSLLCGACKGTGRTPEATVTALAAEMLRIASDMGEPEDPFAAWETIDLIKSQRDQLRKALKPFAQVADMEERAGAMDSVMVNVARCRDARAILASTEASGAEQP